MGIPKALRLFVLAGLVFLCLDLVWLGLVAGDFYTRHLGPLLADRVNWQAALLFYGIYVSGVVVFVLRARPGSAPSTPEAAARGAGFGFVVYSAYELTNLALVRNWPPVVVAVDILWGTLLTAGVCAAAVFLDRHLPGRSA